MTFSRRAFLRRASAAGAVAALPPVLSACDPKPGEVTEDEPVGPPNLFEHGVASGDPLTDAVILWTKLSPDDGSEAVEVLVEVAEDASFERVVASGTYEATADRNHCLKIDVTELSAATTYFYRFLAQGRVSPIGRTRTLPEGSAEHLRFAVCSCTNIGFGWFHLYHYLSQRADLDFVVHLGDYLYEYGFAGFGAVREPEPMHPTVTLEDYRTRYSQYRREPEMIEAHRQHPWITIWDDHEFADDPHLWSYGAKNHHPEDGPWEDRVAAAMQAYDEWMPTRVADPSKIWRTFDIGDLARISFVDIQYVGLFDLDEPEETRLGEEQHAWLDGEIAATTQPWFILAQAQPFTDRNRVTDSDHIWPQTSSWGQFPESRRRVLDAVAAADIPNFVVLTGDSHRTRAVDIVEDVQTYDPATGEGSEGVEFETGSITSIGIFESVEDLPNHHWADASHRTYLLVDLKPGRLQADWFGIPDADKMKPERPEGGETWRRGFVTEAGANHLVSANSAAAPKEDPPPLAP